MENKIDRNNLSDDQGEEMCELCEEHILGCKNNTSHFQCEGSRCGEAFEYLLDEYEAIEDVTPKLVYKIKIKK